MVHKACICECLSVEAKKRYREKIERIDGVCPYEINQRDCSDDPSVLPKVNVWGIGSYLVNTVSAYTFKEFHAYKSLTCFKQQKCGWVEVIYAKRFGDVVAVLGRVKHSQKLGDRPARTWVLASASGFVHSAHCDCMAGLAEGCSHVASTLFEIRSKVAAEEKVSPTERKCAWSVQKKAKKVTGDAVNSIDFETPVSKSKCEAPRRLRPGKRRRRGQYKTLAPRKRRHYHVESSTPDEIKKVLLGLKKASESLPQPIAAVTIADDHSANILDRPQYPLSLRQLFQERLLSESVECLQEMAVNLNLEVSAEQSRLLEAHTKKQSKSFLWYRMRSGRITASKYKAVCRTDVENPSKSLLNSICYPERMKFVTTATKWGCAHEEMARDEYIERREGEGHVSFSCEESGFIINPKFPHMGCSPDGLVHCECCGSGCIEIKCPHCVKDSEESSDLTGKLKYLQNVLETGESSLARNSAYYYQVQCHLLITERPYCDFIVWTPKKIFIERIFPDKSLWEENALQCAEYEHKILLPELLGHAWSRPPRTAIKCHAPASHVGQVNRQGNTSDGIISDVNGALPPSSLDSTSSQALIRPDSPGPENQSVPAPPTMKDAVSVQNDVPYPDETPKSSLVKRSVLRAVNKVPQVVDVGRIVRPFESIAVLHTKRKEVPTNARNPKTVVPSTPKPLPAKSPCLPVAETPVPARPLQPRNVITSTPRVKNTGNPKTVPSTPKLLPAKSPCLPVAETPVPARPLQPRNVFTSTPRVKNTGNPKTVPSTPKLLPAESPCLPFAATPAPARPQQPRNVFTTTPRVKDIAKACKYGSLTAVDVENFANLMGTEDEDMIVVADTYTVRSRDIKTLMPRKLLNDSIINYYLKLVQNRSKTRLGWSVRSFDTYLFTSLRNYGAEYISRQWMKKVNIFEYDLLLFPIHTPGVVGHWSLVIAYPESRTVKYYDSCFGLNTTCTDKVLEFLQHETLVRKGEKAEESKWTKVEASNVPQQGNNYDCGVFVCLFGEHLSKRREPAFTQNQVTVLRRHLALDIKSRTINLSSCQCSALGSDKENLAPSPRRVPTVATRRVLGPLQM